jgi:GNAT superfamily N-acetyltransferase
VTPRTPGDGEAPYFRCVVTRLQDGTPLIVRPIRPGDKDLLADGLARLSDDSRHKRFLSPKPRFTDAELRYLTEVDGIDHVAYVALRGDAPMELVGVARLVRDKDDPARAEIAVTVGDCWQRRGIGRMLGDRLAMAARDRDVRWLTATMAADNVAAHHLFDHVSTQLHLERDGAVDELWADLAAA